MAKKLIKLTESDLHNIIKESVKQILYESKKVDDIIFISYGTDEFNPSDIRPINVDSRWSKNNNKPQGGLWASPLHSLNGWADFCNRDSFRLRTLSKHFIFKLRSDARIYIINDINDLKKHIKYDDYCGKYILDFEKIVNLYDGIYLTSVGVKNLRYIDDYRIGDMYSWDVESICVFNSDVVEPIEENAFEKAEKHKYEKPLYDIDDYDFAGYDKLEDRKQLQIDADFERYRNTNLEDSTKLFKGQHPSILAQLHGNNKDSKLARKFNGTIKSGMK